MTKRSRNEIFEYLKAHVAHAFDCVCAECMEFWDGELKPPEGVESDPTGLLLVCQHMLDFWNNGLDALEPDAGDGDGVYEALKAAVSRERFRRSYYTVTISRGDGLDLYTSHAHAISPHDAVVAVFLECMKADNPDCTTWDRVSDLERGEYTLSGVVAGIHDDLSSKFDMDLMLSALREEARHE